jgi:hypothetical protein
VVSAADAVQMALDPRGYVAPALQDVLLQIFGGIGFSCELDRRADLFRGSVLMPPRLPLQTHGVPGLHELTHGNSELACSSVRNPIVVDEFVAPVPAEPVGGVSGRVAAMGVDQRHRRSRPPEKRRSCSAADLCWGSLSGIPGDTCRSLLGVSLMRLTWTG